MCTPARCPYLSRADRAGVERDSGSKGGRLQHPQGGRVALEPRLCDQGQGREGVRWGGWTEAAVSRASASSVSPRTQTSPRRTSCALLGGVTWLHRQRFLLSAEGDGASLASGPARPSKQIKQPAPTSHLYPHHSLYSASSTLRSMLKFFWSHVMMICMCRTEGEGGVRAGMHAHTHTYRIISSTVGRGDPGGVG